MVRRALRAASPTSGNARELSPPAEEASPDAFGDLLLASGASGCGAAPAEKTTCASKLELAVIPGHVFRHRNAVQVFFNPLAPEAAPGRRSTTSASPSTSKNLRNDATSGKTNIDGGFERRRATRSAGNRNLPPPPPPTLPSTDSAGIANIASGPAESRMYFQQHFHHAKKEDYESYISQVELETFVGISRARFLVDEQGRLEERREYERLRRREGLHGRQNKQRSSQSTRKPGGKKGYNDGLLFVEPPPAGSLLAFLMESCGPVTHLGDESASDDVLSPSSANASGFSGSPTRLVRDGKWRNSTASSPLQQHPSPVPRKPPGGSPAHSAAAGQRTPATRDMTNATVGSSKKVAKKCVSEPEDREDSLALINGALFRRLQYLPIVLSAAGDEYSARPPSGAGGGAARPSSDRPFTPHGGFYIPREASEDFFAADQNRWNTMRNKQASYAGTQPPTHSAELLTPFVLSLHQQLSTSSGRKHLLGVDGDDRAASGAPVKAIAQVWLEKAVDDVKYNLQSLLRRYASDLPTGSAQEVFLVCILFGVKFGSRLVNVTVIERLSQQHENARSSSTHQPRHHPYWSSSSSAASSGIVRATIQQILDEAAPLFGSPGNVTSTRGNFMVCEAQPLLAEEIAANCRHFLEAEAPDEALHPRSALK